LTREQSAQRVPGYAGRAYDRRFRALDALVGGSREDRALEPLAGLDLVVSQRGYFLT